MTQGEAELLSQLKEDTAMELLLSEWKFNGGEFKFRKGGHLLPQSKDGQLFVTLVNKLIELGNLNIQQLRFCFARNKLEGELARKV